MRKYIIAGLLVWMPLGITFLVIRAIVGLLDRTLLLLPEPYQPDNLLGMHIPGLGVLLAAILVLTTGMIVANFLGKRLVVSWEHFLARIPLVRSLYAAIKQIMEAVLSTDAQSFRKVLLIEYPRKGVWSLAFLTSDNLGEVQAKTSSEVISVFIPTTPNPTSGFIIMVPKDDVIELDMAVEDGLKMIISLGVAVPPWQKDELVVERQANKITPNSE
ncbi:MAG: DUF502 domain-containing protein [Gammaproteobacteria bacterium]|jgi:uncharacterized membrane protein|nr:DUF502 domain-containing protein [Gammaproteobacteria bacterium]